MCKLILKPFCGHVLLRAAPVRLDALRPFLVAGECARNVGGMQRECARNVARMREFSHPKSLFASRMRALLNFQSASSRISVRPLGGRQPALSQGLERIGALGNLDGLIGGDVAE